ncbi:hypothetical protein M7I_4102 [Glarea lozoyensis 74030]|uniref:Uncharacterized protein n=1 Tax=Glarea lozoyensis (strain ATCC 74030 / MF5533) TaxID=1104152 RepID=H0EN99_GLAL7|nr:hypothetical protein M7I_4102 [Glarea lozoyensis 74030]
MALPSAASAPFPIPLEGWLVDTERTRMGISGSRLEKARGPRLALPCVLQVVSAPPRCQRKPTPHSQRARPERPFPERQQILHNACPFAMSWELSMHTSSPSQIVFGASQDP